MDLQCEEHLHRGAGAGPQLSELEAAVPLSASKHWCMLVIDQQFCCGRAVVATRIVEANGWQV